MGTNHEHEDVYDKLGKLCYDRAHAVYGDPLPEIVKDRLRLELKFIQDNGYSTIFIRRINWYSILMTVVIRWASEIL